ncbi:hypothetical protein G7Y79_00039g075530 [Physcia stellaris]|nr:hypothetical protein G7Y79_00039g075530 [Physcia stellaris]
MATLDLPLPENGNAKRKRSPSAEIQPTPIKVAKTQHNHLHINYLTKLYSDPFPLISADDSLPTLLSLVQDYDGVLHRHESMAGNLGARPLGPMLLKKFERLFDGPPKVLRSHGKEGTSITWLDVVEFAKNKPEQFNLEKTRDGVRVCQFYTKQSRVEITEDDYELIASGMPAKLIPQQPIAEDEEKELGTLEILSKNIEHIVQLADQVSARARQINHRLKHRQKAINSRREAEASASSPFSPRSFASKVADMGQSGYQANGDTRASMSPSSGFTAVNSRHTEQSNGNTPSFGASGAIRAELLSKFFTNSERVPNNQEYDPSRRSSNLSTSRAKGGETKANARSAIESEYSSAAINSASPNPVPIPSTPSSLLHPAKPSTADRSDDSGPYKAEMVSRMELLQRGDRVIPPCDRCRRLHMDCLKNLTACLGCTKKHAKCSWKDVTDEELQNYARPEPHIEEHDDGMSGRSISQPVVETQKKQDYAEGVRDEELLGEDESDDPATDGEIVNGNGRYPPIQVHVAGSVQTANGQLVKRDTSEELDVEMEPEVQHDIAELQANDTAPLPSPPGAPVPAPASLPDLPSSMTEAPPSVEMEEQKVLVPKMSPQPTSYGNSEYGNFSAVNGNGNNPTNRHLTDDLTPPPAPALDQAPSDSLDLPKRLLKKMLRTRQSPRLW